MLERLSKEGKAKKGGCIFVVEEGIGDGIRKRSTNRSRTVDYALILSV